MKKVLVVEDDFSLADNLKELLEVLEFKVLGIISNAKDAFPMIRKEKPDVILMDISLKGEVNGIELTKKIKEVYQIPVVFLTGHHQSKILDEISFIMDGYLLKPFSAERLSSTIYLAIKNYESKENIVAKGNVLKVRDRGYWVPLSQSEILYLKADGLYTHIFTQIKQFTVREILKEVEDKLTSDKFFRVHKSYTVNLNHVTGVNAKRVMIGTHAIPIRRGLLKDIRILIMQNED